MRTSPPAISASPPTSVVTSTLPPAAIRSPTTGPETVNVRPAAKWSLLKSRSTLRSSKASSECSPRSLLSSAMAPTARKRAMHPRSRCFIGALLKVVATQFGAIRVTVAAWQVKSPVRWRTGSGVWRACRWEAAFPSRPRWPPASCRRAGSVRQRRCDLRCRLRCRKRPHS